MSWAWAIVFVVIAAGGLGLLIWICENGDDLFPIEESLDLCDDQLDSVGTSSVLDQIALERVRRAARWEDRQ